MRTNTAIRRYSSAYIEYSKETIGAEDAVKELNVLKKVIDDCPDFRDFLNDPEIAEGEKDVFIDDVMSRSFSQELLSFLKLLIRKRRINLLADIIDYLNTICGPEGIANVIIKTAHIMDNESANAVKEKLKAKFGEKANFVLQVDPSLIGGIKVEAGNYVIDGSVRRCLNEMGGLLYGNKTG